MSEKKKEASVSTSIPPSEDDLKFDDELPVLPIRNAVLFPGAVVPFDVGREKSGGEHISARGVSFVEAVLAPQSLALNHTLRELEFRNKYGFTVLALFRNGREIARQAGAMGTADIVRWVQAQRT